MKYMRSASLVFIGLIMSISFSSVIAQTNGLAYEYALDEGTSTTAGDSAGNNPGTINGATWTLGKNGNALDFDGINDSVKIPTDVLGTGSLTISVWIYPRTNGGGSAGRIISNIKTQLWIGGTGQLLFHSGGGTATACNDVLSAVPYNTWSHVVAARDASGVANCYVNGTAIPTSKHDSGTPTTSGTYTSIGNYSSTSSFAFDGKIDDVRIYNKVLTSDEISALYAGGGAASAPVPASQQPPQTQTPTQPQTPTTPTTPATTPPTYQSTTQPAPIRTISWTPPLGIPEPSFGIKEDVTMYLRPGSTYDYGNGSESYRLNSHGEPFTHYVENTHPSATDTNNPFGVPAQPRKTIPGNLPAGSVVELHGGPYFIADRYKGSTSMYIHGAGEATKPIFVRGATGSKVLFETDIWVGGSYIILENLKLHHKMITMRHDVLKQNIHHIGIRNIEVYGDNDEARNGAAVVAGAWMVKSDYSTSEVVVYNNYIHDLGLKSGDIGYDYGGVGASGYDVFNIWVLDNRFENLSSGNRFGNNEGAPLYANSSGGYFGRNTFVNGGENAFAIKQHNDVVVSENTVSGFKVSAHNSGSALNVLYNPTNVWLIFNKVTDATDGIKSSGVKDLYIIGNDISNVGRGINYWSGGEINIIGNTITNLKNSTSAVNDGTGIYNYSGSVTLEKRNIVGNIVSGFTAGPGDPYYFFLRNAGEALNSTIDENLFYSGDGTPAKVSWVTGSNTLAELKTKYGKCSGCFEANPMFVGNQTGQLFLKADSPAINQWDPRSVEFVFKRFEDRFGKSIRFDIAGNPRPASGMWDIGAYEYTGGVTIPIPTTFVAGDFNKDGLVNSVDFSLLASAWNQNNVTYDLNKDTTVNTLDYSIMVQNWTS